VTGVGRRGSLTNYQASAASRSLVDRAALSARSLRTRVFYGGNLSWQPASATSASSQGFEEVLRAAHMGRWSGDERVGVRDEDLFAFVERAVQDDVRASTSC